MEKEYISLFDFFNHPAGSGVSLEIYKLAQHKNVEIRKRFIETKKYKGNVNVYPKDFLVDNFQHLIENNTILNYKFIPEYSGDHSEMDLPF